MCCPKNFPLSTRASWSPGFLEEIEDREEKVRCAQVVGDKYSTISSEEYANRAADKIRVFRLNIEHISGKRLVKAGEPAGVIKKGSKDTADEEEAGLFLVLLPGRFGAGCLPLLLGKRASHTGSVRWPDERAFFQER